MAHQRPPGEPLLPGELSWVGPRELIAWLLTLAVGGFAGPILGEYGFSLLFAVIAGVLTALLLGELCVGIAKGRSVGCGVSTVVAATGGLLLAGWYSSSKGVHAYPNGAILAAALAAVVGWLRAGPRLRRPA